MPRSRRGSLRVPSPRSGAEVVAAMRAGEGDIEVIAAGFRVLGQLDAAVAAEALEPVRVDQRLGAFVEAWFGRHRGTGEPVQANAPLLLAALLASATELDGAQAAVALPQRVGPVPAQIAALEAVCACRASSAVAALEALAASSTDKLVAKTAPKQLFRLRSGTR